MGRYGYEDMPDDYSDVDSRIVRVKVECPECGEIHEIDLPIEALGEKEADADGVFRGIQECEVLCETCAIADQERAEASPVVSNAEDEDWHP